jgi:rare lipoprotein A
MFQDWLTARSTCAFLASTTPAEERLRIDLCSSAQKAALIPGVRGAPGTLFVSSALSLCLHLVVCEAVMRVIIIAAVSALLTLHASSAAAQNFEERWSIIPKAHAEPPPKNDDQNKPDPQAQPPSAPQDTSSSKGEATRTFSGKASFYSYRKAKTASGSSFDRDQPTAAHRSLPFGTRVRVTNLANNQSVVVVINDRGPKIRDRVLDLSLAAARTLGITDRRGIADVRGEVL